MGLVKIRISWDMVTCKLVYCQCFGGVCSPPIQCAVYMAQSGFLVCEEAIENECVNQGH